MQLKKVVQVLETLKILLDQKAIFKKISKFMIELDYYVKEVVARE